MRHSHDHAAQSRAGSCGSLFLGCRSSQPLAGLCSGREILYPCGAHRMWYFALNAKLFLGYHFYSEFILGRWQSGVGNRVILQKRDSVMPYVMLAVQTMLIFLRNKLLLAIQHVSTGSWSDPGIASS